MASSKKYLRKGLAAVIKHHGQDYTWGDVTFPAVASTPGLRFGPGPIGLAMGSEYEAELRVDKTYFATSGMPYHGDQIKDPNDRWLTVSSTSEMPGGHTVVLRCRINTQ